MITLYISFTFLESSNQPAFLIQEEGITDEPIILNSWRQKLSSKLKAIR